MVPCIKQLITSWLKVDLFNRYRDLATCREWDKTDIEEKLIKHVALVDDPERDEERHGMIMFSLGT